MAYRSALHPVLMRLINIMQVWQHGIAVDRGAAPVPGLCRHPCQAGRATGLWGLQDSPFVLLFRLCCESTTDVVVHNVQFRPPYQ